MGALADAYAILKTGTLWSSTGRCKGYAPSDPREAAQVDSYIAALDGGQVVAPPELVTATGRGLVGMLAALATAPPSPATQQQPAPASPFGAKLYAFLPRKDRPATVKQIAAGGNLTNLLNAAPSTGGIVYQLQGGDWGPQVLPRRTFTAPVWLEPQPGQNVKFTNASGHALYDGGCSNIVLADMTAEGAANTGFKADSGATDIELIRFGVIGCKNQGLLCAATTARIALWDCYGSGNGSDSTNHNQCHNLYFGDCDTLLIVNLLSVDAPYGSCLQIGGSVRRWRVVNATLDHASSPNGACLDIYTMSTQTPQNQDGLVVNSILTGSGYYGVIGSGTATYEASQVIRHVLSYGHKTGDFAGAGKQFELGDGIITGKDPLYVGGGDRHLRSGSPAAGVGDPDWTPLFDRDGRVRATADLGAYAA